MQKYEVLNVVVPQERRAEINEKILGLVNSNDMQGITQEDVFNSYTGIGGLHGLKREDFANFHEYTEAKKEIEHGQFFTPHDICKQVTDLVSPSSSDLVADITCGIGNFFNYFQEENCIGYDIDRRAIEVARFLYPNAQLKVEDFRFFQVESKVDYVIGNPPFNLKFNSEETYESSNAWGTNSYMATRTKTVLSQFYFFQKSAEIMKPAGLILAVVPESFLQDVFFNKTNIEEIEKEFDFIGQYKLPLNAFAQMGVKSFATKVMCWQKKSESTTDRKYTGEFITYEELMDQLKVIQSERHQLRAKLRSELLQSEDKEFEYKLRKYLYEIKTHKSISKNYGKALAYIERFKNQKCPDGMEQAEWYKNHRITEKGVLRVLLRMVKKQSQKQEDRIGFVKGKVKVKDRYYNGYRLKAYSDKSKKKLLLTKEREWVENDLITGIATIPPSICPEPMQHLINAKIGAYNLQNTPFADLGRDAEIDNYLRRFYFVDKDDKKCYFNPIQRTDLGLMIQKNFGILAWQMGGGKTAGALAWAKYKAQRNTFVISASLAINLTWVPFLTKNNIKFKHIKTMQDVYDIEQGDWLLLSFDFLTRYEKQLRNYVKAQSHRVNLIFDESDEITNNATKRTRSVLSIFKRVKRKLLTTGTTTRNNIGELYSQLELLYNNSCNFMSWSEFYYVEEKSKEDGIVVKKKENRFWQKPFPPYYGQTMFKRCFNPSKTTVFGIQKQDQNLYNETDLKDIISKTVITRKFREIAGDKYAVENIRVQQDADEKAVYKTIIKELDTILPDYFNSTGNAKKDVMLRTLRQLSLLVEATSTPQLFDFYSGTGVPTKAIKIADIIETNNEKVSIGCTSKKGAKWYQDYLTNEFPDRGVFYIDGDISFKARQGIIARFEATTNGILVSTQQSLKSSVNIPTSDLVIVESLQWNIPKIEQWYFRFIRYNSVNKTKVVFVNYGGTIETNLLALLMAKERLNDYVKTLDYKENSAIYTEYDIDLDILNSLISKQKDEDGKVMIKWGEGASIE